MLLGIKVISKFIAFDRFAAANVSKNHPAAANVSYSRVLLLLVEIQTNTRLIKNLHGGAKK
jgi:hypothetical protein